MSCEAVCGQIRHRAWLLLVFLISDSHSERQSYHKDGIKKAQFADPAAPFAEASVAWSRLMLVISLCSSLTNSIGWAFLSFDVTACLGFLSPDYLSFKIWLTAKLHQEQISPLTILVIEWKAEGEPTHDKTRPLRFELREQNLDKPCTSDQSSSPASCVHSLHGHSFSHNT